MKNNIIFYEQPLNERIRTFLRLESLFKQLHHNINSTSYWDSRNALYTFIEVLNLFERGDFKSEIIKELDRHFNSLTRLKESPGVDTDKLQKILIALEQNISAIKRTVGRFGQRLKDIELIAAVKQRLSIPGGTCHFDIPSYHFWLSQEHSERKKFMDNWLEEFKLLERAIELLLDLTRDSAHAEHLIANHGFYQKALDPTFTSQLIRVSVPFSEKVFAEISGGKHRISIRFLTPEVEQRPMQIEMDIAFTLYCCGV